MCSNSLPQILTKTGLGNMDYLLNIMYKYTVNSTSIKSLNNRKLEIQEFRIIKMLTWKQ